MLIWVHPCILTIRKDILILGNVPLDRLDDTKLTIGKEYPINFSKQKKKFILVYTVIDATVIYLLMV